MICTHNTNAGQGKGSSMEFRENRGCGTPFFLNGNLTGWICRSINDSFMICLAGTAIFDFYQDYVFANEMAAKLEIMSWIGE